MRYLVIIINIISSSSSSSSISIIVVIIFINNKTIITKIIFLFTFSQIALEGISFVLKKILNFNLLSVLYIFLRFVALPATRLPPCDQLL